MNSNESTDKYYPTAEEMDFALKAAEGLGLIGSEEPWDGISKIANPKEIVQILAQVALPQEKDDFAAFAAEHMSHIRQAAQLDEDVARMLLIGYKIGVQRGSGGCMNDLGALYNRGEFVEQDYSRAKELYEMARDRGCFRAIVNLGYIYEYGRLGEKDYEQAYKCYALACALAPDCEAEYKLGDMYWKGQAVEESRLMAVALWSRAMDVAENDLEFAQPAVRLAPLFLEEDASKLDLEYSPMNALMLFQRAEVGLRKAIEEGDHYYKNRLEEAIRGQRRAREVLDQGDLLFE